MCLTLKVNESYLSDSRKEVKKNYEIISDKRGDGKMTDNR